MLDYRKAAQSARLINRDFPWLWAIRNSWFPEFTDIKAINIDATLSNQIFYNFLNSVDTLDIEVWVRYGFNKNAGESLSCSHVNRVGWTGPARYINWAARILGTVAVGLPINNVVTIQKDSDPRDPEMIRIYRARFDKDQIFNKMLIKIVNPPC